MSDERKLDLVAVGKGILIAIILTFILILIIAAVCYFATVQDKLLSLIVLAATGISVLLGALAAAKNVSGAGLLHGMILGVGYVVIMILSNLVLGGGLLFNQRLVSMIICVISCGMLGGILGINTKK